MDVIKLFDELTRLHIGSILPDYFVQQHNHVRTSIVALVKGGAVCSSKLLSKVINPTCIGLYDISGSGMHKKFMISFITRFIPYLTIFYVP